MRRSEIAKIIVLNTQRRLETPARDTPTGCVCVCVCDLQLVGQSNASACEILTQFNFGSPRLATHFNYELKSKNFAFTGCLHSCGT